MTLRRSILMGCAASVAAMGLAVAGSATAAPKVINVKTTSGLSYQGMPSTLKAGTYTFRYSNPTAIPHNLKVGSKATPVFTKGTRSITVTLKKGKVAYICTVPGHGAAGMKGTITVK